MNNSLGFLSANLTLVFSFELNIRAMAFGASYLTVVDILARSLFTFEVPVGIFTTFAGAPFFIILLKKVRGAGWD